MPSLATNRRHNLGYWTARPFLGFGPSALSYWNGERFRNIANINELLAVRIRLTEGANLDDFELCDQTKASIEKLRQLGLVKQNGPQVQLTERGTLFYDTVASEIVWERN